MNREGRIAILTTLGKRSGPPICNPDPSTEGAESRSPVDSRLWLPIGDPDPSTEGVGTHRGRCPPRWRV
ncbi:hypothetical protein CRG98_046501 [Punica granatum]|uniref:Uncharacterized protein n=1 Tax=Punica granatum TaxID=22663 RepID=A0A2I0HN35_PUNGR|nr:hypothetical protein CRG98_046501 [Punica granatum]